MVVATDGGVYPAAAEADLAMSSGDWDQAAEPESTKVGGGGGRSGQETRRPRSRFLAPAHSLFDNLQLS